MAKQTTTSMGKVARILLISALLVGSAMADEASGTGNNRDNNDSTRPSGGSTVSAAVITVEPKGGESLEDLTPYDLSCPDGTFMTAVSVSLAKETFTAFADDPDPATTGKDGLPITKDVIEGFGPMWCGIPSKIFPKTVPTRTTPAAVSRGFVSAAGYRGIIMRAGFLIDAIRFVKPEELQVTAVRPLPRNDVYGTTTGLLKGPLGGRLPDRIALIASETGQKQKEAESADEMAGGTGGRTQTVECPPNHLITGLWGMARKENVVTVGLRCRKAES